MVFIYNTCVYTSSRDITSKVGLYCTCKNMHILAEPVFIAFTYTKWRPSEFESGGGAHVRRQAPEKNCVRPSTFLALSTISGFGECFRDGQYSLSVSCLPFFYSWCPPRLTICKSGGTFPPAPWSQRHCLHCAYDTCFLSFTDVSQEHVHTYTCDV